MVTKAEGAQVRQAERRGRQTYDAPIITGRRFVTVQPDTTLAFTRNTNPDRLGYDTYDQLRRDSTVSAALTLLKAPILGRIKQATVVCDNPAIKAAVEEIFIGSGILYRLGRTSLRALEFGAAFHEIEWAAQKLMATYEEEDPLTGKPVTRKAFDGLAHVPAKFLDINPQTVVAIRRRTKPKDGKPGDGSYDGFEQARSPEVWIEPVNSFVYTNDMEFGNLWGTPRTKAAYPYYFWLQFVMKSWMYWLERKADPSRIARHPPGNTNDVPNSSLALTAVAMLDNASTIALPSDTWEQSNVPRWDVSELATSDRVAVFRETANELKSEMLKAMFALERTFTPARETGTYAEAAAHTNVFLLTEDALAADWIEAVNKYAVSRVVALNWGTDEPCEIVLPGLTDEERAFLRELFLSLVVLPAPNENIDLRALAERYNVPVTDLQQPTPAEQGAPIPDPNAPLPATGPEVPAVTQPGEQRSVSPGRIAPGRAAVRRPGGTRPPSIAPRLSQGDFSPTLTTAPGDDELAAIENHARRIAERLALHTDGD